MFIPDREILDQLRADMKGYADTIQNTYHILDFNLAANYMAGTAACYGKALDYDVERAHHFPVLFIPSDTEPKFDPDFNRHATIYHIGTRAAMCDEVFAAAKMLPSLPKEFLKELKEFGDRIIDDTETTLMTFNESAEKSRELVSEPFVALTCRIALRISTAIMFNAMEITDHKIESVRKIANQAMIACCRYLERIGISPSVVEGSSDFGNTWFDLKKKRMRDISGKITWFDPFTKQEMITTFPFNLVETVRRDRNS